MIQNIRVHFIRTVNHGVTSSFELLSSHNDKKIVIFISFSYLGSLYKVAHQTKISDLEGAMIKLANTKTKIINKASKDIMSPILKQSLN